MSYFLNDNARDKGLAWVQNSTQTLYITSQLVSTYAMVTSYNVGIATMTSVGAPGAGSPDGRQVSVPSTGAGSVTSTATASSWALTNSTAAVLVAASDLSAAQSVTSGNTFTLTSFTIRIPL